jgi:hypothetical protein
LSLGWSRVNRLTLVGATASCFTILDFYFIICGFKEALGIIGVGLELFFGNGYKFWSFWPQNYLSYAVVIVVLQDEEKLPGKTTFRCLDRTIICKQHTILH